ncbi:hypothetical protein NSED_02890 [Candidatus Nitrosopumilus sediminis]|uniref:Uncharacterized protein n=1 Tax=Candidatus Nitrosopumilus sediminis TaxID=1229909 RepID=K0BA94_9ARCH|nr:hypothetical protein NSED_02890 [Candidatus Nitrosopumilus sediminis]
MNLPHRQKQRQFNKRKYCGNYNSKGSRFPEPHAGQLDTGFNPTSLLKTQPQLTHTLRSAFTMLQNTLYDY